MKQKTASTQRGASEKTWLHSTETNDHSCYRTFMNSVKNSQFTWIFVGNRSHAYKIWAPDCKGMLKDRNCFMWIPRWLYKVCCTLMVEVKQVYAVFWETVGKIWEPFVLSNHLEKHWAPRWHYTKAATIESVSLRWLGSGARSPSRRNRSNRFKTGPARMFTLC